MAKEQICTPAHEVAEADLRLEIVSDPSRFCAMRREWDLLMESAGLQDIFLSHLWLTTWWESFGKGKQLHVVTVREGDELIAAAPMMMADTSMYGVPIRRIESIYNYHTPRSDFIVAKRRREAYRLIWHELSSPKRNCDVVQLTHMPAGSSTLEEIEALAQADGWSTGRWSARPAPFIRLGCDYETFFLKLKGHYRYNLRKRYERLLKIGAVDIEVVTEKSAVRQAMEDGLKIEAAAWKGEHGTAMNSDADVAEFYISLAERAAELGWLRLTFLLLEGKPISFDYILHHQDTLYGVKIGYDPEYHTYSPGNMLLSMILQEACKEGIVEYDFLGVDDEWKYDWTKDSRQHEWLFAFRNRLRPKLVQYVKFNVVPNLKRRKTLVEVRDRIRGLWRAFK